MSYSPINCHVINVCLSSDVKSIILLVDVAIKCIYLHEFEGVVLSLLKPFKYTTMSHVRLSRCVGDKRYPVV